MTVHYLGPTILLLTGESLLGEQLCMLTDYLIEVLRSSSINQCLFTVAIDFRRDQLGLTLDFQELGWKSEDQVESWRLTSCLFKGGASRFGRSQKEM